MGIRFIKYLLCCILFAFVIANANAQQDTLEVNGQKYIEYNVVKGITLYSISKKFNVEIDHIVEANDFLMNEGLKPGQVLKIPVNHVTKQVKTDEPVLEEGYIAHTVQKGETLYALSKQYLIKPKEIIELNPPVLQGLKEGMVLKLPKPKSDVDAFKEEEPNNEEKPNKISDEEDEVSGKYVYHTIVKGETLYALSKKYETEIVEIENLNPEIKDGLKLGQVVKFPIKMSQAEKDEDEEIVEEIKVYNTIEMDLDSSVSVLTDTIIVQEVYNVAMLLPFYLDMNDTLEVKKKAYEDEKIYKRSKIALQFYQGALLALDSLKQEGVAVKLHVFDTDNDTANVVKFIENKDSIDYHLIIGPLYRSNFEMVSNYAQKQGISIVTPVPQSNKVLLGNEFVSKSTPSRHVQVEFLAEYVVQEYSKTNAFIINPEDERDQQLVSTFMRKVWSLQDSISSEQDSVVRVVNLGRLTLDKLKQHLDSTTENTIVIPSTDAVYVYDLLTMLNRISESYSCTVFGLDKWLNFNNLETDFLHDLNIHVASPYFVDYNSKEVKNLLSKYHKNYFTEPTKYGFIGYDVTYYYVKSLARYGVNMQAYLTMNKHAGISSCFEFFKTGIESGYENKCTYILRYKDFNLERVK